MARDREARARKKAKDMVELKALMEANYPKKLTINDGTDLLNHLTRLSKEVDEVTTYMFEYMTQGDEPDTEASQEVTNLFRRIDDDLGELFSLCMNMMD